MKCRNGFVSNSSSSSFIIAANKLDKLPGRYNCRIYIHGEGCLEGEDMFPINPTLHAFLRKNPEYASKLQFYEVFGMYPEGAQGIKKSDLPDHGNLWSMDVAYDSCKTFDDFQNRYAYGHIDSRL